MTPTDLLANFREKRQDVGNMMSNESMIAIDAQVALVYAVLVLAWAVVQVAIAIKEQK